MFNRGKPDNAWVPVQALVLDKKDYLTKEYSGTSTACRYKLRVKFDDGSTAELTIRAFGETLASAARVGDLIPVRHDPTDRSRIELDHDAIVEQRTARETDNRARALARGERALGSSTGVVPETDEEGEQPDTTGLRIGDADRELVASLLTRHTAEGRLTDDELEDRLGTLYSSHTRGEVLSVLADLPPLAPVGAVLPDWLQVPASAAPSERGPASAQTPAPSERSRAAGPTDGEMNTVYRRWQAKAERMRADKAAHARAEASGDPRETALALRRLTVSRAEEKSARAKLDQLRKRRPDWKPAG